MRLLTKVMTGVSVAALSVLVAGGINAEAATFSADKHMAGITSGDMVSYDAVKDKGGKLTWNAKAKWDTYYGTVSYVDISSVKTTKDAYITVKSAAGYNVYKIEKDTVTKYAGKITTALEITAGTDKLDKTSADTTNKAPYKTWANYQYRTENGAWESLTASQDLSLVPYEQQGATLYFRYKGATAVTPTVDATATIEGKPDGATVTVNTIAANSFASKEFKVKVPKMGNAPTIAIDYAAGAVKAKKGSEYRVGTTFTDATTGWKDFDTNYTIDPTQAGIFQMRTKATEKKAASKIAVYNWAAITAPTVVANTVAGAGADIVTGQLKYTSKEAADKKTATFEIENTTSGDSAKTFVLYKAKMSGTTVDMSSGKAQADGKAVATLAPGKKIVLKDAKVADGTVLLVQYAGDKKADKLPSGFASAQVKVIYNVKAS